VGQLIEKIKQVNSSSLVKAASSTLNDIITFILKNEEARQKENNDEEEEEPNLRARMGVGFFDNEVTVIEVDPNDFANALALRIGDILEFMDMSTQMG